MYLHTFKINVIFSSIIAVQSHCDIVTCTCPYRTRSYCASNRSQRAEAWPTVSNLRCAVINENEGEENEQKCEWDRMRVKTDEDEKGWERGRMRVSIYVRIRLNERENKKECEIKRVGKKESGKEREWDRMRNKRKISPPITHLIWIQRLRISWEPFLPIC